MKRAIVVPDQHFPLESKGAMGCVLKALEIVRPQLFINLGDVGEWEIVSSWKGKQNDLNLTYHLPLIDYEIGEVNEGIDQFDEALDKIKCKQRFILEGNHDNWLNLFVENKVGDHPVLEEYTFEKACYWKERGYKFYEMNRPLKIGKLNFIHGSYTNIYHAKKHLEVYGSNIMYGHCHDVQRHTLTKLDAGTIGSWSIGCLKDMRRHSNKWLRGRLHNWRHAFAIVTWWKNGNFQVEVIEITNGRCFVWGEEITGGS